MRPPSGAKRLNLTIGIVRARSRPPPSSRNQPRETTTEDLRTAEANVGCATVSEMASELVHQKTIRKDSTPRRQFQPQRQLSSTGTYLRQWGSPASGPGQFAAEGGAHPHCVIIGEDRLVYVCDRGNARVEVCDRRGAFFYPSDVGSGTVWILNRVTGTIVSGIGGMGQLAGEFIGVHTMVVDSKGNLYVSEGGGGRRTQKFVKR